MGLKKLPADLPDRLRAAGLAVVVIPGWRTRGRPGATDFVGVMNHHTGASAKGWSARKAKTYAKGLFTKDRGAGANRLPAPLCQVSLGRGGIVYLGAAGRANHAGKAKASGSVAAGDGNTLYVGIEWMLSGTEKIPAEMYDAGVALNSVLLDVLGSSEQAVTCHYDTSVTGKWDIGDPGGVQFKDKKVLDLVKFRRKVKEHRKPSGAPQANQPAPTKVAKARRTLESALKVNRANLAASTSKAKKAAYTSRIRAIKAGLKVLPKR